MARLRRVTCSERGYTRHRVGRGFAYYDEAGQRVTDPETIARIRNLVIPPAWTDVWICRHPNGHIQALGTDVAGRRQYRYHDLWRERRDREKFDHMLAFARALPKLRRRIAIDLRRPDLDRQRVLACAVRLLDIGFFRIGGEDYAEQHQTYGLATMLKSHVAISGVVVTFDYLAKSGKQRLQQIAEPAVVEVLGTLKRRRGGGPRLLAYRDHTRWVELRSNDINTYLKAATGGDFSAKDFRTWSATVFAAVALAVSWEARSTTARKLAVARAVKEAAHYLGNTPAVCRASYVDPRVITHYEAGTTIRAVLERLGRDTAPGTLSTQGHVERAVLDMLADAGEATLARAG